MPTDNNPELIPIGRFGAPFGVRGWIKVNSFTHPIENILEYSPWQVEDQTIAIEDGKVHSQIIIAKLPNCNDRDLAQLYTNKIIAIPRAKLPPAQTNEYYWLDLLNLTVTNVKGEKLGIVEEVIATGANDVLVIKDNNKKTYIPFTKPYIQKVDLDQQEIIVDWELDW